MSIDGVVTLIKGRQHPRFQSINGSGGGGSMSSTNGPSSGTIYLPIPTGGGGGIPQTWSSGMVCYRATIKIGSQGGVQTQEVVAADCISDVDSSCPPSCGGSVGEVFDSFDPIGLIGG